MACLVSELLGKYCLVFFMCFTFRRLKCNTKFSAYGWGRGTPLPPFVPLAGLVEPVASRLKLIRVSFLRLEVRGLWISCCSGWGVGLVSFSKYQAGATCACSAFYLSLLLLSKSFKRGSSRGVTVALLWRAGENVACFWAWDNKSAVFCAEVSRIILSVQWTDNVVPLPNPSQESQKPETRILVQLQSCKTRDRVANS